MRVSYWYAITLTTETPPGSFVPMNAESGLEAVRFNADGLVPVVAQDVLSGDLLMVAYANREALQLTAVHRAMPTTSAGAARRSGGRVSRRATPRQWPRFGSIATATRCCTGCARTGPACHTGSRTCFVSRLEAGGATERPGPWRAPAAAPRGDGGAACGGPAGRILYRTAPRRRDHQGVAEGGRGSDRGGRRRQQ